MTEEKPLAQDWVVCETKQPEVPKKKKKRGYSFWKYLGWGSSSKKEEKQPEPIPVIPDDMFDKAKQRYLEENPPKAVIHDSEILDCFAPKPAVGTKEGAQAVVVNDEHLEEEHKGVTVEPNKMYPVEEIATHQDVYEYLDQLIEVLRDHKGDEQASAEAPIHTELVPMPELPDLSEKLNTSVVLTEKMTREYFQRLDEEDRKRREDAELVEYFEQLARELDECTNGWEDFELDDYMTPPASPVSPASPASQAWYHDVHSNKRPRRPPTPYHRRDTSEEEVSSEEVPAKRCKMSTSLESSDMLSRMERGEFMGSVLRKRPASSPLKQQHATPENKFHALLDRIADDDDDSSDVEYCDEETTVLEMICEEFIELGESIAQLFRRSPC
uniref:Uncharacterized protein n=1 Tax=viral metagenome TaxID=1070528 RepID=A0A6C0BLU2_9ZZZZ